MSDALEFKVDTRGLVAAKAALEAVSGASKGAEAAAGRLSAATSKGRDAQARATAAAQQAAQAVQQQTRQVDALASAWSRFGGAIKGAATVETLRRMVMITDEWQQITTRIALATRNSETAAQAQGRLFRIAQETRTEYGAIANLFGRLTNATRSLGVSQDQVLSVTRAISQSFTLSGASAAEAASSAMQIGQALGFGALQGDELRATLENNARLAQAIADGLGVSVGQLKAMGAEGQLTSSVVFEAILKQARALNAEFSQMGATFSGAMTQFANALKAAIAENSVVQAFQRLGIVIAQAAAGALEAVRDSPRLFFGVGAEQSTAVSRAAGQSATFGAFGASVQFARPSAVRRELDAIQSAQRAALANPLFGGGTGGTFGLAGLNSGLGTLQSIGIGVPQGFTVGAPAAADDALAAMFRARGAGGSRRLASSLPTGILGGRATTMFQAYETLASATERARAERAERLAAGRAAIRVPASVGRGLDAIGTDIQRSLNSPEVQRALRLQTEAQEARRQMAENLRRGVFEGLQQPIAEFLRTWSFSVKQMGDLLRDALANAIASVLANEATKLIYAIGRGIRDGLGGSGGGASGGDSTFQRVLGWAGSARSVWNAAQPGTLPVLTSVPGGPTVGASAAGGSGGGFSASAAASNIGTWASRLAPPAAAFAVGLGFGMYADSISGGNAAARRFNAENARRFRERQAMGAAWRAQEDAYFATIPAGGTVSNAPADFDVARYRLMAGPPDRTWSGGLGGGIVINNLNVPGGTTREQVDAFLDELSRRAIAQSGNPTARDQVNVS